MAQANELFGIDQFIYTRLAADAALVALVGGRIFSELARPRIDTDPATFPFPFVSIGFLSGVDRNAQPAEFRILTNVLYLIKAVTTDDGFASANAIADRIDIALTGAEGQQIAEGIFVGKLYREELIRYVELEEGRRVNHCGGRFRSMVSRHP